jgi:hypothetical protein
VLIKTLAPADSNPGFTATGINDSAKNPGWIATGINDSAKNPDWIATGINDSMYTARGRVLCMFCAWSAVAGSRIFFLWIIPLHFLSHHSIDAPVRTDCRNMKTNRKILEIGENKICT